MSRGGLLSVVYATRRPTPARGVLNFAGGWMAEFCDRRIAFHARAFGQHAEAPRLPMLWVYTENDRNSFLPRTPAVWSATVDAWLKGLGF